MKLPSLALFALLVSGAAIADGTEDRIHDYCSHAADTSVEMLDALNSGKTAPELINAIKAHVEENQLSEELAIAHVDLLKNSIEAYKTNLDREIYRSTILEQCKALIVESLAETSGTSQTE